MDEHPQSKGQLPSSAHIMGLKWFWVAVNYPEPSFRVLGNQIRPLAVTPNTWMNTLKVNGNIHLMGLTWFWVAVNYPKPSFRVLENQVRPLAATPNPWMNTPKVMNNSLLFHGSKTVLGCNELSTTILQGPGKPS